MSSARPQIKRPPIEDCPSAQAAYKKARAAAKARRCQALTMQDQLRITGLFDGTTAAGQLAHTQRLLRLRELVRERRNGDRQGTERQHIGAACGLEPGKPRASADVQAAE